jgi:hypothetical protein
VAPLTNAQRLKQVRAEHPDRYRAYRAKYYVADVQRQRERARQYRATHRTQVNARQKQKRDRLRAAMLDHYGRACACCGSTERLCIDHVNGDGREHRAQLRAGLNSSVIYKWLIDLGYPENFQTLCQRCNTSKGTGPACRIDHVAYVPRIRTRTV